MSASLLTLEDTVKAWRCPSISSPSMTYPLYYSISLRSFILYKGENDETMAPVYVSEEGSIKDNDVRPSSATDSLGRHPL